MGAVDADVEGVSFSSKTWTTIPFVELQGHGSFMDRNVPPSESRIKN
jgi:hypothetical protein